MTLKGHFSSPDQARRHICKIQTIEFSLAELNHFIIRAVVSPDPVRKPQAEESYILSCGTQGWCVAMVTNQGTVSLKSMA